jgi:hypothetical protein
MTRLVYCPGVCRECGCDDDHACDPPCHWVEDDLCSACTGMALGLDDEDLDDLEEP